MKRYLNFLPALAWVFATASCVDDAVLPYAVKKPESIAQYEYLNDYNVLKSYIDRSKYPDFKLGLAVDASDFINKGAIYETVTTNFDEMTAGNAMKYSWCVGDDGSMNFSTVSKFVEMARAAGVTIYGHTLAWHAQQNNKYLNSLIKDKELEVDPDAKVEVEDYMIDYSKDAYSFWNQLDDATIQVNSAEGCLDVVNPTLKEQNYFVQYHIADGLPLVKGKEYKLTIKMRGSEEGSFFLAVGPWGKTVDTTLGFTTDWQEYEFSFTAADNGGHIMLQSGHFVGTLQIKYAKITHSDAPALEIFTDIVSNGDAEGSDTKNFVSTHIGSSHAACDIVDGVGVDGSRAFVVTSNGGNANSWDTQFFVYSERPFMENDVVLISFDYRADVPNSSDSQTQSTPGNYLWWDGGCGVNFTSEWQHFEKKMTISADQSQSGQMQTFAWNLEGGAPNAPANKYYFDNVKVQIVTKGNTDPLTPEEKKAALTLAMNTWVEGMMKATKGYVTAWDVVNEPLLDGGPEGEFWPLKSAENMNPEEAKSHFYWQDYLGEVDYVRIVVAAARKYYAENGGTQPLKLFINDYNLEAGYYGHKKVKSLVHWIQKWEEDGVTKIDGIGTQMHTNCHANPDSQREAERNVEESFRIMAASGKLVKISELDMGFIDEDGNSVKTADVTEEQHKAMAEFYKFIIKKYFEIVPVAQQYGITQWCATDASVESGWRGGEPVGLWDLNFNRKHTYAGFADGLAGK